MPSNRALIDTPPGVAALQMVLAVAMVPFFIGIVAHIVFDERTRRSVVGFAIISALVAGWIATVSIFVGFGNAIIYASTLAVLGEIAWWTELLFRPRFGGKPDSEVDDDAS